MFLPNLLDARDDVADLGEVGLRVSIILVSTVDD